MRRPKIYQRERSRFSIFRTTITENFPELKKHEFFLNQKVHQAHGKVNTSKHTPDAAERNCGALSTCMRKSSEHQIKKSYLQRMTIRLAFYQQT